MGKLSELLDVDATGEGESKQPANQDIRKPDGARMYLMHLAQLVLNPHCHADVRILASAKLTKILETQWCSTAESFLPPEINSTDKEEIKALLLKGLQESNSEVREAAANAISAVVESDSQGTWAGLIETLVGLLNEENEFSVHGGLSVLRNIRLEQKDTNFDNSCATILRAVSRIFATDSYSTEIRCLACEVLTNVSNTLIRCEESGMIRQYLQPALSQFCTAVIRIWTLERSNIHLKTAILNAFRLFLAEIPTCVFSFLPEILPLVWESLIDCAKYYQANVVQTKSADPERRKRILIFDCKSEANPEDFLAMILEFIVHTLTGRSWDFADICAFKLSSEKWSYLQNNIILPDALRHLIMLMEIPAHQIEEWNTHINDFVHDEEMKTHCDGHRRRTEQLIADLEQDGECAVLDALTVVIMKHLEAENAIRAEGQPTVCPNSWQSREAILLAFGVLKKSIISKKNGESPRYDVVPILKNIVLADSNDPVSHPFLVARCLCIGGLYADLMPLEIASDFLKATVNSLQENNPTCLRACAAKAVSLWYCRDDSQNQNKKKAKILRSHVPALFRGLLSLCEDQTSKNVCILVSKSIASLMPFVKAFTASVATRIYSLTELALLEYHKAHDYFTPWLDILAQLLRNANWAQLVQERLVPKLVNVMSNPLTKKSDDESYEEFRKGSAILEIVGAIVYCSPLPLSDLLIDTLFPACCNFVASTDDFWILNFGIGVVEAYIIRSIVPVAFYKDKNGKYGAQYALQVITHVLNQKTTRELPRLDVACEISKYLVNNAWPQIEEGVNELFRALIFSIRGRKIPETNHKFWLVYAYVMHAHFDTVLGFLANEPSPPGLQSPLELVISKGFCGQYYSFDREDRKSVEMALEKIFKHGLTNLSSPLHRISFKEKTGQTIPLLAKISRLMINDKTVMDLSKAKANDRRKAKK